MKKSLQYTIPLIVWIFIWYWISLLEQSSKLTIDEIIDRDNLFCSWSELFTNDGDVNYMIEDFKDTDYLKNSLFYWEK